MAGLDDGDYLLKKLIASGHIRPTDPVFDPADYEDIQECTPN